MGFTPALQMHYGQLEALAFNEEFDPDSVEDFTLPPTEIMKKVRVSAERKRREREFNSFRDMN
jgi:hypothetical protein